MITQLDYMVVKEVIRLLPHYSQQLDFDIIQVAYRNVLHAEYLQSQRTNPPAKQNLQYEELCLSD